MNEEELRLRQAGVGTIVSLVETATAAATPPSDAIAIAQPGVDADLAADLSMEELDSLLAKLQHGDVGQHKTVQQHEQPPQQQDMGPDADSNNPGLDPLTVNAVLNAVANDNPQESQTNKNEDVNNKQNESNLFQPLQALTGSNHHQGERRDSQGAGSMGYEDPTNTADMARIREEHRKKENSDRKKLWRAANPNRSE
jgi:hypothetical protein